MSSRLLHPAGSSRPAHRPRGLILEGSQHEPLEFQCSKGWLRPGPQALETSVSVSESGVLIGRPKVLTSRAMTDLASTNVNC